MITAVAADPVTSSSAFAAYRHRSTTGERTLLPESPPPAPKNASAGDNGTLPQQNRPAEPLPEPEHSGAASMFAAAVIAGALPPAPKTMKELILRIGAIPIPPESEARLKDLLA